MRLQSRKLWHATCNLHKRQRLSKPLRDVETASETEAVRQATRPNLRSFTDPTRGGFMKKQLFALLGLGLLFATASAYAQTAALKANIPFNFVVTGKSLPAGEYTIQSLSVNERVLTIRGADKSANMIMVSPCESAKPSAKTRLVFHRYGERYFLS